jgi:predicted nucleic-acid-binding Zn-ribbon protein
MSTHEEVVKLQIPDGYEFVRFGVPLRDEYFIGRAGYVLHAISDFRLESFIIVRHVTTPKPPYDPDHVTCLRCGWDGVSAELWYSNVVVNGVCPKCGSTQIEHDDRRNFA